MPGPFLPAAQLFLQRAVVHVRVPNCACMMTSQSQASITRCSMSLNVRKNTVDFYQSGLSPSSYYPLAPLLESLCRTVFFALRLCFYICMECWLVDVATCTINVVYIQYTIDM